METLTIKELVPYLPYGLKLYLGRKGYERNNVDLIKCDFRYNSAVKEQYILFNEVTYGYFDIKPLLRPLSDLTKEIEHNGERFVPINKILREIGYGYTLECYNQDKAWILNDGYRALGEFPYRKIKFLFELHFDVFGLIPKNLAIDINQIK